jgi:general secretion pathway protein C
VDVSGKQASFGSGEKIAGESPVVKIFPDRVIINEDGYYASLMLAE